MGEINLPHRFEAILLTAPDRRGRPLSYTIHTENCCLLKRTWKKGRSRVGLMMLCKKQLGQLIFYTAVHLSELFL